MNKKLSKVLHTGIAAAMMLSMGNFEVFAEETDSKNNGGNETETTSGNTEKISINNDSNTEGKDETVYVITDASGEKQNVIVSDWLKNGSSSDIIKDYTTLKDIVNVKGDETYSTNNDGSISWNAEGNDIYYQGTTDAELPVAVKISYQLDGADISAEDLAGKSGHVTIRFDYENNSTKDVMINGKKTTIKTPFAMVSGLELPNDKFSNIEVENGKVISEGDNAFVIGMAFPGLKESLDLDDDKDLKDKIGDIEIPEYVQIEADVTDFSLEMTMTLASSSFLSDLKVDDDGTLDELKDDMNTLQSSAQELVDGTQTLKDGTGDLVDGAKKLDNGASDLKSGTSELYDGAGKLVDGAGTLKNGTSDLYTGTSKVDDGAGTLKNGTSDLYAGTSKVDDGAGILASGASDLKDGTDALSTGARSLAEGTSTLNSQVPALTNSVAQLQAGATSVATGVKSVNDNLKQIIDRIEVAQGTYPYSLMKGMQAADTGAQALYATLAELQKQYVDASNAIDSTNLDKDKQTQLQTIASSYDVAVLSAQQAEQAVIAAKKALDDADKKTTSETDTSAAAAAVAADDGSEEVTAASAPMMRKTMSLMKEAGVVSDNEDEAAAEKDAQISDLTAQNNTLTSKNKELENSNSDLQNENNTLTAENQTLQDQNSKLQSQNKELSKTNQDLQAQIASLQAELAAAKNQTTTTDTPAQAEDVQQKADTDTSADVIADQAQQEEVAPAAQSDDTNTNVNFLGENAAETDTSTDEQAVAQAYVSGGSVYTMDSDGSNDSGLAAYPTAEYPKTSETGAPAEAYNTAVDAYNAAKQTCVYLANKYKETATASASATNSTKAQLDALNSIFGAVLNGASVTIVDSSDPTKTTTYKPSGNVKSLAESLSALNSGLQEADKGLNKLYNGMQPTDQSAGLVAGAKAVASGLTALNTNAGALAAGVDKLNTGADNVKTGAAQVAAGASRLNDGATSLKSGTSELKSGAKQLDDGASSLKSGTSDLKSGAKKLDDGASDLKSGTSDLKTGAKKLDDGASDLKNGTSDLVDGAVKLDDGAQELLDGMTKFKEEGIDKLADLFGDNLTDVIDRLKEVCDAGAEYSSFAGNDDNGTNTVKFIFKTDAIKSASDSEN